MLWSCTVRCDRRLQSQGAGKGYKYLEIAANNHWSMSFGGSGISRSWFVLVVEPYCWGLETLSYNQLELVRRASECAPRGPAIATWDVWTRSDLTIALLLPANEIMPIHLRCWRPERDGSQGDGYLGFGNIRLEGFASVARVRSYQSWVGRTYLVCWNGSYSRACGYLLGGCWRL